MCVYSSELCPFAYRSFVFIFRTKGLSKSFSQIFNSFKVTELLCFLRSVDVESVMQCSFILDSQYVLVYACMSGDIIVCLP